MKALVVGEISTIILENVALVFGKQTFTTLYVTINFCMRNSSHFSDLEWGDKIKCFFSVFLLRNVFSEQKMEISVASKCIRVF